MKLTLERMLLLILTFILLTAYHMEVSNQKKISPQDSLTFDKVPIGIVLSSGNSNFPSGIDGRLLKGLSGYEVTTQEGRTKVTQNLRFRDGTDAIESGEILFTEDEKGKTGSFLHFTKDNDIFEYLMTFDSGLNSRIDNNRLEDLEDERLYIMGGNYVILNAKVDTNQDSIELDLIGSRMGGPYLMVERETRPITYGTKNFVVSVMTITNDNEVIFKVNGVATKPLTVGETQAFNDGTIIGIISVLSQEAEEVGGDDMVEFAIGGSSFGGGRVRLIDNNYADNQFQEAGMEVGGKNINAVRVMIRASELGDNKFRINEIRIRLRAEGKGGDIYIPAGHSLAENMMEPTSFFTNLVFNGVGASAAARQFRPTGGAIQFEAHGDDEYRLVFTNNEGNTYNIPYIADNGGLFFGDTDGRALIFNEAAAPAACDIQEDDYFIVNNDQDSSGRTHVLQYDSFDGTNRVLHLTDLSTGRQDTVLMESATPGVDFEGELVLGGNTYDVYICPNGEIAVDMDSDGNVAGNNVVITTLGGGFLEPGATTTYVRDGNDFDEPRADQNIDIDFTVAGGEVDLDVANQADLEMNDVGKGGASYGGLPVQVSSGDEVGVTSYGELFVLQDDEPNELTIMLGSGQLMAQVSVKGGQQFGSVTLN